MKVFISWSGEPSREVAEALRWWLPKVLQVVRPFVSAKDIDKGATWASVLAAELEDTAFGIVCLTPENLLSPWLHYETGAMTKSVDSRVCPALHGVEKGQVDLPMSSLMMVSLANYDETVDMLRSMNATAGAPVSDAGLVETVELWWPKLVERLEAVEVPQVGSPPISPEPAKPTISEPEILSEVLSLLRQVADDVRPRRDGFVGEEGSRQMSAGKSRSPQKERALRDALRLLQHEGRFEYTVTDQVVRVDNVDSVAVSEALDDVLAKVAVDTSTWIDITARKGVGRYSYPPF